MKQLIMAGLVLFFFTSFTNEDTGSPVKRKLFDRIFKWRAKQEQIKADTRVSLIMTQRLMDSTNVLLDSLKLKNDSITKKE
jgi:hypothetical protein